MNTEHSTYRGHRYPAEVISHAVWLYRRFCLSFRDVEDLLAERAIIASSETVHRWFPRTFPQGRPTRAANPRQLQPRRIRACR